ncbi:MAG: class II aldolase/adducin family protein [Chloroherpetonaceae bacterium]|nr:class II aldolase/adducin family protein [Chloroherpetonaceae bacterium]
MSACRSASDAYFNPKLDETLSERLPKMNFKHQQTIADVARKCAAMGFVASYDGNISLRADEGIYITATRTLKAEASPDDVCLMDWNGKLLEGKRPPSTESLMHLYLYKARSDVKGIVHAHPPATTAFAVARKALDLAVFPEVILDIGPVPLAQYATPSTDEVPRSLAPFAEWANAILLANHGVVVLGGDVYEALFRTEKLEHAAKTLVYAQTLGGVVPLTRGEVDYLYETHKEFERRGEFAEFQASATCKCEIEKLVCRTCEEKSELDFVRGVAERVLKRL